MTRTAYLAGPIFGRSDAECRAWRILAREALEAHGWGVRDPMVRDYRGLEAGNDAEIVERDLEDIAASDALIVMALGPSWGTAMEVVYARQQGTYIVAVVGGMPVSPWLRYHADDLVAHPLTAVERVVAAFPR